MTERQKEMAKEMLVATGTVACLVTACLVPGAAFVGIASFFVGRHLKDRAEYKEEKEHFGNSWRGQQ